VAADTTTTPNPAYNHWVRQDQLILHGIVSSVTATVVTHLGTVKTSQQAWEILKTMYAGRSRVRVMARKQRISTFAKGTQSMSVYLQGIKVISDELSIIDNPLDNTDLVIHTLNGLGNEYKEISAALRSRETPIEFAELHEKLMDFETLMRRDSPTTSEPTVVTANAVTHSKNQNFSRGPNRKQPTGGQNYEKRVICQYCEKPGHSAKVCYKIKGYPNRSQVRPTANVAAHQSQTPAHNNNWIMDTGASHHITQDLQQLTLAQPYPGSDQVLVGDGTGLQISHTGQLSIPTPIKQINLKNVLHVPNIKTNLLSVSKLCKTNHCSVEFFPDYFVVKDLKSGQALLHGPLKQDLYHLPLKPPSSVSSPHAFSSSLQSPTIWHHILGHPAPQIIKHLSTSFQIPIKCPTSFECSSCQCAKSHKLPFSDHNLKSTRPLELIYSDVWGPAPIRSLDGFLYYVIFVDHFTKYVWLYPIKFKSDVHSIFIQFKSIVEKYFNLPIITLFSDNGGEFIKLKPFLTNHGITHLSSPPHTPELNGTAERRHRHIVETGRALLYHANLPPQFWSYAFTTATYLINRMPTPILNMKTPYQALFNQPPNYNHLHSFGCLCFPWLRPYTTNKLQNRSKPCIFLGYSNSHHAFLCLDPSSNRVYISRHVNFVEHSFPYHSIKQKQSNTVQPTTSDHPLYSFIPFLTTTNNQSVSNNSQNSVSPPTVLNSQDGPVSEAAVVSDLTLNANTPQMCYPHFPQLPDLVLLTIPAVNRLSLDPKTISSNRSRYLLPQSMKSLKTLSLPQ
jgi:hypothetical protein